MVEGHFFGKKLLVHKYQLCQHLQSTNINTIEMQNELNEQQTCVFHWQFFKFFLPTDLLTEQASFLKTKASFDSEIMSFIKLKQNNK